MNRTHPPRRGSYSFLISMLPVMALLTTSAFALDESEVQSAIAASSSEQVSGNVFIWFLCAVAFLKISQKIDSFMTSLGINVGRTGGSMLGELMIAGRALGLAAKSTGSAVGNIFNHGSTVNNAATSPAGQAFTGTSGGIIGSISRAAGNAAAANATGAAEGIRNSIGGAIFDSSLKRDGQLSRNVIGAVATGSISSVGSITGPRAAQALTSYLGYELQNSNNLGESDASVENSAPVVGEDESVTGVSIPVITPADPGKSDSRVLASSASAPANSQTPSAPGSPVSEFDSAPVPIGAALGVSEASDMSDEPPSEFPGVPYIGKKSAEDTITLDGGSSADSTSSASTIEASAQGPQFAYTDGYGADVSSQAVSNEQGGSDIGTQSSSIPQAPPTFRNVEIGGGRITGYETPADGGEERQFAMYNASQYMEPSGPHETVKTTDGESWYKQYAQPTVQKTPKEVGPGKIRYDEKIVQTMPQIPKRKDRV